jgi:N-acetylneuraminic acid mutarotase
VTPRPAATHAALVLLLGCGSSTPGVDAGMTAWRSGPTMPSRRLEPGVAALGTNLVVLGGFDTTVVEGLHITTTVDVFDTLEERWIDPLPPVPVAWSHINLASANGQLFVLGGLEGTDFVARGESWVLDPGATSWRSIAPLPAGLERGASGVVATATHIYVLGGASTDAALASCLDYDIAKDRWTELPALPAPRSHPAAMQLADGTLIVAAGLATIDASMPLDDVWALPPGATAWEPRAAKLGYARGGCAYAVLGGALICAGGEASRSALRFADAYDPVTDVWRSLEQMPGNRAGIQGVAIGDRFYVPGGAAALIYQPTDTLYIYMPAH